jgi:hypothetical protein
MVHMSVHNISCFQNNCYFLCYEEVTRTCVNKLLKKEQKNKKDKKRPLTSTDVISKCGAITINASDIGTCNDYVWVNDQVLQY